MLREEMTIQNRCPKQMTTKRTTESMHSFPLAGTFTRYEQATEGNKALLLSEQTFH